MKDKKNDKQIKVKISGVGKIIRNENKISDNENKSK